MDKERIEGNKFRVDIIKKFAVLDEKSEPKIINGQFEIPDDKKADFEKEMSAFMDLDVQVESKKVSATALVGDNGKLICTTQDLMNLEPILDMTGFEDEDEEEDKTIKLV